MSDRVQSVAQKRSAINRPLFRYMVAIGQKLAPIISLNSSDFLEKQDKIEEEHKISVSLYGTGGPNQILFMRSLFKSLRIIEEQSDYRNEKNQIGLRYADKGCLLLFMYSELDRKTPKDPYKRVVQSLIKGFFHFQTNITLIFVDITKNKNENHHVNWFKHYLYDNSPDKEYFVVYCLKEGENKEYYEDIIKAKQMGQNIILNISKDYQETTQSKANSYRYNEKHFPNINYFFFVIPNNYLDIDSLIRFNTPILNFFESKISTTTQGLMKQINKKQKNSKTFVTYFKEYLSFFISQVVSGKRFPDQNDSIEFRDKNVKESIHLDPSKSIDIKNSLKLTCNELINFNPNFSHIPTYNWEKKGNEMILTFKIAAQTIKATVDKPKNGNNIINISKLLWKVLKPQEEADKCEVYFSTHLQAVPEFKIEIPLSQGVLKKKMRLVSNENGFLKIAYELEESKSDSD